MLKIDVCLYLSGELSKATAPELEKSIRTALEASPRELTVDLTDVETIDDAGLTTLLKAHLRGRRHGLPIRFVPAEHSAVKQIVAVTGTDESSD